MKDFIRPSSFSLVHAIRSRNGVIAINDNPTRRLDRRRLYVIIQAQISHFIQRKKVKRKWARELARVRRKTGHKKRILLVCSQRSTGLQLSRVVLMVLRAL
jgi:hypothetical protein